MSRRGRGGEQPMVPEATFDSYYGRPIVRASPWANDIPAYLFLGGLAAGSSLLAAGADLTGRRALRRAGRLGAAGAITASLAALVHDLGRPARFGHMLRVVKPTSPMSMGTWLLTAYAPAAGMAAAGEGVELVPGALGRLVAAIARPAGLGAAALAPMVACYTAVLLADTASPAWHQGYRELPLVFAGSAAAAAGGLGMLAAPLDEAGPARRVAVGGAILELVTEHRREAAMGIAAEAVRGGAAGRLMRWARVCTAGGAAVAAVAGGRHRGVAALSGTALLAGSALTRFGIFAAGQASARDPRYTVVPQRLRRPIQAQPSRR